MKRVRIVVFFDCVMAVFLLCLVFQQRFFNAAVETGKRNEMIQEETKRVALTFDDGPNPEYTEKLLDGLKDREVKATFFSAWKPSGIISGYCKADARGRASDRQSFVRPCESGRAV